jgi:hypothetical protein
MTQTMRQGPRYASARRPDMPCSIGAPTFVSHVCANVCSAMKRRAASGFSSGQMKSFSVGCQSPELEKQIHRWTVIDMYSVRHTFV